MTDRAWGAGVTILIILSGLALAACTGDDRGIQYTGSTTPAVINAANAEDIALRAYWGIEPGGKEIDPANPGSPAINRLMRTMVKEMEGVRSEAATGAAWPGPCGGTLTTYIDETSTVFSGTMVFNGYCEPGLPGTEVVLTGAVGFSVSTDTNTFATNVALSYEHLAFETLDSATRETLGLVTVSGSIASSTLTYISWTTETTTAANVVMLDNPTGRIFKVENYTLDAIIDLSGEGLTFSGRFFHHDHGSVEVSTPQPVVLFHGDSHPSAGVVKVTGSGGSAARLEFLGPDSYRVTADPDGDGIYDFDSGIKDW
jgi:hypothetical protein